MHKTTLRLWALALVSICITAMVSDYSGVIDAGCGIDNGCYFRIDGTAK